MVYLLFILRYNDIYLKLTELLYVVFNIFRYSEFMKKKSVIIGLPVVTYNQSKHSDVCQYLEHVQKLLVDIYKPQVMIIY